MAERAPDVIMAEYLLKGGKMLAKTCQVCGAPLFEYKGETKCVVCEEKKTPLQATQEPPGIQATQPQRVAGSPASSPVSDQIKEELAITILSLCRRIREESEPDRCLVLAECVRKSAEALRQVS